MKPFKQFYTESNEDNIDVKKTYWDKTKTKPKEEIWYKDGGYHRLDGPAYQRWYENGQKMYEIWYKDGRCHRLGGPAHQEWHKNGQKGYEIWCKDDESHRLDGPAYQVWDGNGRKIDEEYFINGKEYSKEEFYKIVDGVEKDQLSDFGDLLGVFE